MGGEKLEIKPSFYSGGSVSVGNCAFQGIHK